MSHTHCLHCGKGLSDTYCAGCGHNADTQRISFKHFIGQHLLTFKLLSIFGLLFLSLNHCPAQTADSAAISTATFNPQEHTDSATIYVLFTVEATGEISEVKVDKISCKHCSKSFKENLKTEAMRVVSSMPPWKSNKEGKKVHFRVPLKMILSDDQQTPNKKE